MTDPPPCGSTNTYCLRRLPLPATAAGLVGGLVDRPHHVSDDEASRVHPGLWLTHFVHWSDYASNKTERWRFTVSKPKKGGTRPEDVKRENFDRAARAINRGEIRALADHCQARREAFLRSRTAAGLACTFQATTDWRLVTGLAIPSPLELNLVLHPLYGFPILPGSGVKGLALAAAEQELGWCDRCRKRVFGTNAGDGSLGAGGLVDFLEAIPVPNGNKPLVHVDVLTPHFSEWYQGGLPTDDQQPSPHFFLAVAPNVEFQFALVARVSTPAARRALEDAKQALVTGLTVLGSGAKTGVGYGYFQEPSI